MKKTLFFLVLFFFIIHLLCLITIPHAIIRKRENKKELKGSIKNDLNNTIPANKFFHYGYGIHSYFAGFDVDQPFG